MSGKARTGIRRAVPADLAEIRDIWLENELTELSEAPSYRPSPSCFRHELEAGETWVAESAGVLLGFTAIMPRHGFVYLAELFVRPRKQSAGVGSNLLAHVTPGDGRTFCTLSSTDRRAHTLYLRAGMRPRWLRYCLRGQASEVVLEAPGTVEVVEAEPGDTEFLRLDSEIGGFLDGVDHAYWIDERSAQPLWFRRDGERIGFGYVQMRDDESFTHPDALTIGPLGALRPEDAADCAAAAAAWACARADVVNIAIPGPHPALGAFVSAGFKIVYIETFYSSSADPVMSVERYLL